MNIEPSSARPRFPILLCPSCHVDEPREAGEGDICIVAMERGKEFYKQF